MLTLLFVGDINLGRTAGRLLKSQSNFYPFAYVEDTIKSADLACGNLESQIANITLQNPPWYILIAPPEAAPVLKRAGFDYLSLANNHSWDGRATAVLQSISYLKKYKIGFSGAGKPDPLQPYITEVKNTTIAIFSVTAISNWGFGKTEQKYIARATSRLFEKIKSVKSKVDLVIVSYHGDFEYKFFPTQRKIIFAKKCIEVGADIFWGHHPHYIQGEFFYKGKLIAFSLGNFVFAQKDPNAKLSYILKVYLNPNTKKIESIEHIPIKAGFTPVPLPPNSPEGKKVLRLLKEISYLKDTELVPWYQFKKSQFSNSAIKEK